MTVLDVHIKEKNPAFVWNAPKYYDHPDGEDLPGKLSFIVKHTTAFSTIFGLAYAGKNPKSNVLGKIINIAKFTVPGAAIGFAFTCVTYCSTVYRKKDDPLNHALGGVAAGLVLAPATGSIGYSAISAFVLGSIAYMNKQLTMTGYSFGTATPRFYSSYYKRQFSTTLAPHIEGNWTKDA